uniref:Uncharacterized protein n=1 Tax=Arundo donax TaxID=35708 RepID=A0A0A9AQT0_ARUDO
MQCILFSPDYPTVSISEALDDTVFRSPR